MFRLCVSFVEIGLSKSTWTIEKDTDSLQFWEDRRKHESDYQLRETRETITDLDRLRNAPVLPPALWARINRYLEQFESWGTTMTWEEELRYLNAEVLGSLLLERAGITPLTAQQRVSFDRMNPEDHAKSLYPEYVTASKALWLAWRNRDHEAEWEAVEAKAKLAAGSQPEVLEVPVNDGVQG